ncbi:hypothetical protein HaLaN_20728, partial [Haematococcus lacustris]
PCVAQAGSQSAGLLHHQGLGQASAESAGAGAGAPGGAPQARPRDCADTRRRGHQPHAGHTAGVVQAAGE